LKRFGTLASLAVVLGLCTGCGSGFSVGLHADPDPANSGQSVKWTLTVRNDTACATADDVKLPPPFPSNSPPIAFIVGFDPDLSAPPAAICNAVRMCTDETCLMRILGDAVGADTANQLMARAQAEMSQASSQLSQLQSGMCSTTSNGPSGFLAMCELDPLAAGATDTVMFVDTAPDSIDHQAAQLAFVSGAARGTDCRPGTETAPGEWALAGCFPANSRLAPAVSSRTLGACAALLTAVGVVLLYRRRRA